MGGTTELTGPDFSLGVEVSTLEPGGKLLGHAFGDAVLLARVGNEYFAIGATCTHYGGPLAEGIINGEEVRCPWHHACFRLRTGEALRAPALSPLACYEVKQDGTRVAVTKKKERDPLAPFATTPKPTSSLNTVVIIGGGAA